MEGEDPAKLVIEIGKEGNSKLKCGLESKVYDRGCKSLADPAG